MSTVDKIIYNALVGRKAVEVPNVGVLRIESTPAQKGKNGEMIPPQNRVVCSDSAVGAAVVSVIDEISEVGGVGEVQSVQIFNDWYESAHKANVVHIAGVGEVADGVVKVDAELAAKLNPTMPDTTYRRRSFIKWIWILLLVFVVIVGWWVFAYWDSVKERFLECQTKKAATEIVAEQPALEPVVEEPIGAQSAEGDQRGYHVIVGVFDVEANADRMIARMADEGYTSTYKFIPGRARFYVTAGRFDDEADAIRLKRQIDEVVPDVWVYKYRVK